jgi:hypothetical protein
MGFCHIRIDPLGPRSILLMGGSIILLFYFFFYLFFIVRKHKIIIGNIPYFETMCIFKRILFFMILQHIFPSAYFLM